MQPFLRNCAAPAKLNLFLHVIGQRKDGYHLLQTVFQLIDWHDFLHFTCRNDSEIRRVASNHSILEASDLTVRAAKLMQQAIFARKKVLPPGVDIDIEKNIPIGGGLGGGSSDAATTLMALNYLWEGGFTTEELMALGVKLGADIPFFLLGQNAYAEGIGEKLTPIITPDGWFVVIVPAVSVSTEAIFRSKALTRNTEPIRIASFSDCFRRMAHFGKNDLQPVASQLFPEIGEAINELERYGKAGMTGSGSCVFARFENETEAREVGSSLSRHWTFRIVRGLKRHPFNYLADNGNE